MNLRSGDHLDREAEAVCQRDAEAVRVAVALKGLPEYRYKRWRELLWEAHGLLRLSTRVRRAMEREGLRRGAAEPRYSLEQAAKMVMGVKHTQRALERFERFKDFLLTQSPLKPWERDIFAREFDSATRLDYPEHFCRALIEWVDEFKKFERKARQPSKAKNS